MLSRADRPPDAALCDGTLAKETLTQAEATGQHDLLDRVPPYQELPLKAVRHIVDWLSQGALEPPQTVRAPDVGGPAVVGSDALDHQVIETPVAVPPVGLFGMVTEPADGRILWGRPWHCSSTRGTITTSDRLGHGWTCHGSGPPRASVRCGSI